MLLSESEIKCLLRSDRGSQLSKGAESLFPVLIIGLCRSCINSSLKVLNHIFKPRNDCANCGSSNFCIQRPSGRPQIRQDRKQLWSCKEQHLVGDPVWGGESWLAAVLRLLTLRWALPLGTQLCGEKELWKSGPKLLLLESCPPSPCDGSVCFPDCQGWNIGRVAGCEPSFIYPGCWHRAQERGDRLRHCHT